MRKKKEEGLKLLFNFAMPGRERGREGKSPVSQYRKK